MSRPTHTTISATNALPKVVRGKGSYLWDATGKQYIDGSGGPAVYCLGHANPEVNAAVTAQMADIAHGYRYNFTTTALNDLTDIIRARGGADTITLTDSATGYGETGRDRIALSDTATA